MDKYKEKYKVIRQRDNLGKYSLNKDDMYILCSHGIIIYRYGKKMLAVSFVTTKSRNLRIEEMQQAGVDLKLLQDGDSESTYTFPEEMFKTVAKIVGVKKRVKRNLTEAQKKELRERLAKGRKNKLTQNTHKNVKKP